MDPTVHVSPYSAKASVELVSSVMSPMAALITATFPFRAPLMQRTIIMNQKVVDSPLDSFSLVSKIATHKRDPENATPARPMKMTGLRPIRLCRRQCQPRRAHLELMLAHSESFAQ